MSPNRRNFVKTAAVGSLLAGTGAVASDEISIERIENNLKDLEKPSFREKLSTAFRDGSYAYNNFPEYFRIKHILNGFIAEFNDNYLTQRELKTYPTQLYINAPNEIKIDIVEKQYDHDILGMIADQIRRPSSRNISDNYFLRLVIYKEPIDEQIGTVSGYYLDQNWAEKLRTKSEEICEIKNETLAFKTPSELEDILISVAQNFGGQLS